MMQRVMADLGKMVLLAINVNTEHRHRGWGCVFRAGVLLAALSICNSCAFPRAPIAVSCYSMGTGQVVSRQLSEGAASTGESRGMRHSKVICKMIYDAEEFEKELEGFG